MKQLMTKFVSRCAVVVGTFALVLSSCTVSDVEADIDALDEKYEELASTQVADTESQTEALEAAFAEAETLISEQSDALTTLREEMEAEIASLNSDIENNYVTKEELAAEVEALEEEVEELESALTDSVSTTQAEVDALEVYVAALEADIAVTYATIANLELLEARVATLGSAVDDINTAITNLESKDAELQALIESNDADITTLQEDLVDLATDLANEIARVDGVIEALAERVTANEESIVALNTTLAELTATVESIRVDLQSQIDTLGDEVDAIDVRLTAAEEKITAIEAELVEVWAEFETVRDEFAAADQAMYEKITAEYEAALIALEESLKTWTGEQLAVYWSQYFDLTNSVECDAFVDAMKALLTDSSENEWFVNQYELDVVIAALDQLESDFLNLKSEYEQYVADNDLAIEMINELITTILANIDDIDGRVGAIEELIEYITYVPTNMWGCMTLSVGTYDWFDVNGDGGYDLATDIPLYYNYVTVDGATTSTEYTTEATFRVYPAAKVADITAVTANVVEVVTRATAYNVDVEILSYDETEGTITVEIATDYDYPTNAAANETISMAFDFTYDRGVVETTDEAGATTTTTKYEEKVFQTDYVASVAIDGTPAVDATDVYYSNVDTDVVDDGTVTYTNVWYGTTFTAFALNDKEIETTADYSVYYTTATELAADADLYVDVDGAFVALETLYDVTLDFVAPTTAPTYTGNRANQYDFYATYVAISLVGYSGDKFVSDAYSIKIDGKTIASNISETILVVKSGDLSGLVYDLAWDYSTAVVASPYQTVDIDMLGELNTNAMTYTLADQISSYPEYDGTSNTDCYIVSINDAQGNDVDPAVFDIDDVVFTIGTVAEGTAEIALTTSSSLVESATYYVTIEFWYKDTDEETASTITATVNVTGAPAIVYAGDDVDVYQTLSKTNYTFATVYDVYDDYAKNATIDQFGSVAIFKEAMYGAIESNPNANGSNYTSYTDGSWYNAFYGGSVETDDLATDFYVGISAAYTTGGATVVRTYDYVDATGFSLSTTANLTVTSLEGSLVHNPTYVYVDSSDFYTTFFSSTLTAGNSSTLATLTTRDIETALLFDYDEIIADANPVVEITYELDAADASYATIADDANGDEHLYMASALSALEVTLTAYLWVNGIMVDSQVFDAVVVDPLADRATGLKVSSTFVTDGVLTMDIDDDYDLYDEFELMSINTGEYPLNDGFPYNIFGSTVGKTILTLLGGDLYVDIVADPTNGDSRMLAYDSATQTLYYDYSTTPVLLEDQKFTVTITYEDKYTAELGATNTITFEVIVEKTATVN
ncbi:MAG: hypothetical protein SNI70_10320 [Rikenellaceae bacterium]